MLWTCVADTSRDATASADNSKLTEVAESTNVSDDDKENSKESTSMEIWDTLTELSFVTENVYSYYTISTKLKIIGSYVDSVKMP